MMNVNVFDAAAFEQQCKVNSRNGVQHSAHAAVAIRGLAGKCVSRMGTRNCQRVSTTTACASTASA